MMHDNDSSAVVVGIDTHADTHHVAVITNYGRPLVDVMVPATASGYRKALALVGEYSQVDKVGIECTGSYGAGITRKFLDAGYTVVEPEFHKLTVIQRSWVWSSLFTALDAPRAGH
ncbi:transposase [Dietzia sp. SYD-A1]|uniref:IS110 family transposase n=1 Tax=Dietzia sp. SYD-A1 TaxID=2780141 RepID=UPI0018913078|nr:transposase [Dietzia sp. SYD-A1]